MATYELKNPELWLPSWAQGKNLPCEILRIPKKDGTKRVLNVPAEYQHGGYQFETTDEHSVQMCDVDPRFTKIS